MKACLILAGITLSWAGEDPCHFADKAGSYAACAAVSGCQWCETSGLVPARPTCVSSIGASFIPKEVYTCHDIPRVQAQASIVDDDCDDDDNDICDLHKNDAQSCMANPMCTWC